jgi:hypothetical protein
MQSQNLIQLSNKAEELFAELCEGELEFVSGGKPIIHRKHGPTVDCKIDAGELAAWTAGGAIGGGALGAIGGFFGSFLSQAHHNCP